MKKIGTAVIRWSQDAQVKFPVTILDKAEEIRITYRNTNSPRNTLRARFDGETGVLMMRGGPLAREQWLPVLTGDNKWVKRVVEVGGLVTVFETEPEAE